jgi:VWFA-related protein
MRLALLIPVAILATAAALVTAVVVTTGRAGAQTPPSFAARSELVTVDVVVLSPDGKPVPGLTRDDFVVKEDGRAQTVTAFEAVEAMVPALQSPTTIASAPSQTRLATNVAGPPTRRTFAIVFDDLHVDDINMEQVKRAIDTFVTREARGGDRLVLFTVSDGRYWATTRGGEDTAWREALLRVRSHKPLKETVGCRVTHYEAMRILEFNDVIVKDLVDRRLVLLCPQHQVAPDAALAGLYTQARTSLASSLRVVREAIRSLGETPGRKSLVLVTEGFPVDPSLNVFREVREQAARANVAITFLDARGLSTGVPEFMSAGGTRASVLRQDVGLTIALWRLEDGGSKALAEETGGLVLQTNDLVSGLMKVADESRVTYLLGYEPTNEKRDGRYRRLKVEVRRPGLQVRARSGYFAAKGSEKPAPKPQPVDRALRDVFDADGIPLRLAVYVMGPAPVQSPVPKTGLEVLIAGEVRLDALESRVKDGRRVAEPKLKLLTGSREGESHESEWTLEVVLSPAVPPEAVEGGTGAAASVADGAIWHPFLTRIAMGPGDHRARLVVQSGGRIGSVTRDFIVPSFSEERLSPPILSDRLVAGAADRRVMPLARRDFDATNTLHCWIELHGAAVDPATGQPRATLRFAARSAAGREWASAPASEMKPEANGPTRLVSLPLAQASAGENELVLTVRDEVSGRSFESREPFRVAGLLLLLPAAVRAQKLDNDDKKFLSEMRPLILPEEEAMFKKLKDKAERLEFQKIFWARRDSDLATPENEFQQQYLKARATADQNYHVAGTPGSATDCGRVFILLGKPDEVQSRGSRANNVGRAAGTAGLVSVQDELWYWIYRDRPERHFRGGQAIIAFDSECCAASDLAQQLDRIAAARIVHPNIDYKIAKDGHLVKLADQLPKDTLARTLVKRP